MILPAHVLFQPVNVQQRPDRRRGLSITTSSMLAHHHHYLTNTYYPTTSCRPLLFSLLVDSLIASTWREDLVPSLEVAGIFANPRIRQVPIPLFFRLSPHLHKKKRSCRQSPPRWMPASNVFPSRCCGVALVPSVHKWSGLSSPVDTRQRF